MRTIAYTEGGGGLILAIFMRTYYVDDPKCSWQSTFNY